MQAATQQPSVALVTGAADGIGLALVEGLLASPSIGRVFASTRDVARADRLSELMITHSRLQVIELDINNAAQLERAAVAMQDAGRLDLVINTAGVLHDADGLQPERRLADVSAANLMRAFETNALSTLLLAKALEPLLRASRQPVFASLSARVASIGDNRLGGWYAYRASKAALNMMIKTLSIERSRFSPKITCVALHPGTVRTALSEPFVARRDDEGVFSPRRAADHLLELVGSLQPAQTGNFYAWDGQTIPW
jgi:NAD(P)-dependent dehydrogenase (short-subunit alcohol dehydrogenase family)